MKKRYSAAMFRKVLLPVIYGDEFENSVAAARAIAGDGTVLLVGMVSVSELESLSMAATPARNLRRTMHTIAGDERFRLWERVIVSHHPWNELMQVVQDEQPDLLLLDWPFHLEALHISFEEALSRPHCNVALLRGPIPESPKRILTPLRGGPYAELALSLSLSIGRSSNGKITTLHITRPGATQSQEAAFRGIERVLSQLSGVQREVVHTDNPKDAILSRLPSYDLIVMGATSAPGKMTASIGPVAELVLRQSPAGVIVVKTSRPMPANLESEVVGQSAISVLVDKWFAENTYHGDEFSDLEELAALKRKRGLTISLALPALNEEETVGTVISTVKTTLMDNVPLLDEIVLMDSDSSDRTREIAAGLGIPVYVHQQIFPDLGARHGKGEALWKSLYVTRGDIVLWIDTDIVNIHPRFVYGLIGPLLLRPNVQFVKGFYRRPIKVGDMVQAGGGGRVTELTARPLLNLFYPELSGVIQPLSGEYGGRRSALEQMPFSSGYGVEIGLLIDTFEKFGLDAIAQVDLQERVHHNQPLESLSKMSFAIIQTVIHKLEHRYGRGFLEDVNRSMKLIRYEPGHFSLDVVEIAERERPPMVDVVEYRPRVVRL